MSRLSLPRKGIGREVSYALRAQFDNRRESPGIHALGAHIDGLYGAIRISKPVQHAPVLKAQAGDKANAERLLTLREASKARLNPEERVVFHAQESCRQR